MRARALRQLRRASAAMLARIRAPARAVLHAAGGCAAAASLPSAAGLPPARALAAPRALVRCAAAAAARGAAPADLFGDDAAAAAAGEPLDLRDERPLSRTLSKKRCACLRCGGGCLCCSPVSRAPAAGPHAAAPRAAEEFRRVGKDLVGLPPKTLARLALPSDLQEAIDEARFLRRLARTAASAAPPPRLRAAEAAASRARARSTSASAGNAGAGPIRKGALGWRR